MTASYRIGTHGMPQCPHSCGRTGTAHQGRFQLYPRAYIRRGNVALHMVQDAATAGCIRVIATIAETFPILVRDDVRLTMWEVETCATGCAVSMKQCR
ncbi:hypothetical protein B1526_1536 [Bifidobacterium criceti]|uniref:Uncharacterized protein n=1 Tax=Bifidobacterium criceti TaxID=1960969 RepID=A0A2A2EDM7_9BIFI|nr:hypothetical protein B1526_1536 [Bifidobacterium criceti]